MDVVLAFVRLATHSAVFRRPLDAAEPIDSIRGSLSQPAAVVVDATRRHVDVLGGLLAEAGTAGNLVNDAHLAALAVEHDAVLVSLDADSGRLRRSPVGAARRLASLGRRSVAGD